MGLFGKSNAAEAGQTKAVQKKDKVGKMRRVFRGLRINFPWIFWGLAASLSCAVVFSCFYQIFCSRAESSIISSPIESSDNIAWLYQNCYLLYRDLYNAQSGTTLDYSELYCRLDEEYGWIYERSENDVSGEAEEQSDEYVGNDGKGMLTYDEYTLVISELQTLRERFQNLDDSFRRMNANYDYWIRDSVTGKELTNMSIEERNRGLGDYYFYLTFEFDKEGNVVVGDELCGQDETLVRKRASEVARENIVQMYAKESDLHLLQKYGKLDFPRSCVVTFAISKEAWAKSGSVSYMVLGNDRYWEERKYNRAFAEFQAYNFAGVGESLLVCIVVMALMGLFLPVFRNTKPWKEVKLCSLPLEVLIVAGIIFLALNNEMVSMVAGMASGRADNALRETLGISRHAAAVLAFFINLFALTVYFFLWWYMGVSARAVREFGIRGYIRQRSLVYSIFPFCKRKLLRGYDRVVHLDLTRNAHSAIIKLVLVNAALMSIISCFWLGGVGLILVYSVILYIVLRKYISDLQDKYKILLKATNEMAEGRLNISIDEDLGVFEPFKPQVFKIQEGFRKAVDEEVKSQRMKAELITNVSHDLKTPLTAIITYINLLKEENVTEEQRREYLDTLERKSLRLKVLIEDLFEVSKANSENISLNIMDVDIMNLVKQVQFEMSDKLSAANLDVRMNLTDEKIILPLDSQKTYRIFENLFGNIAKYALPGTRVYVNGFCVDDKVLVTLKNISAQEITVESSELLERFVRGDASRNTEGSGLGLAIAKSFTQIQGGELSLEVDGDLFKVTVGWTMR